MRWRCSSTPMSTQRGSERADRSGLIDFSIDRAAEHREDASSQRRRPRARVACPAGGGGARRAELRRF